MNLVTNALAQAFGDVDDFARHILKRPLRAYQREPLQAIAKGVLSRAGADYVVRFPRQSGKNEMSAILDAYLLFLFQRVKGASIIHTAPTFDPQAQLAKARVLTLVDGNPFFAKLAATGDTLTLGRASATYVSGKEREKPRVGLTASVLLKFDEAQDLNPDYCDRAFQPMRASTNACAMFTGTARHDQTYLALARKQAEEAAEADHLKRVWVINWRAVADEVPAYGDFVKKQIATLGARHPIIQNEYENIENEQTGKLFDARRIGLIFGADKRTRAITGRHVITIDVGGTSLGEQTHHDPTICAVHRLNFADGLTTFTTINYLALSGENVLDDTPARARLLAFIKPYKPAKIVSDATGLGVGFCSWLSRQFLPSVVMPLVISEHTKTQLFNSWLALIETGRYKHFSQPDGGAHDDDYERFNAQLLACTYEQRGAMVSWGIPASKTWVNPLTHKSEPLHDDYLLANSMTGILSDLDLAPRIVTTD